MNRPTQIEFSYMSLESSALCLWSQ